MTRLLMTIQTFTRLHLICHRRLVLPGWEPARCFFSSHRNSFHTKYESGSFLPPRDQSWKQRPAAAETTNGGLGLGSPHAFMGTWWVYHFFTLCS